MIDVKKPVIYITNIILYLGSTFMIENILTCYEYDVYVGKL